MDHIYKEIVQLQFKCNDYIDDHSSSSAQNLKQEVQRLEDEAQVKKNAYSLEDRVNKVIRLVEQCGDSNSMSHGHISELVRRLEELKEDLRKLR